MIAMPPETMPRSQSVFKPALLLMCGRTLAFAATFFIPVVLVRIFDPTQFGTYKQLFLILSTAFLVAQVGMAASLYYFLPLAPQNAGRYLANSLFFLGAAGLVSFAALMAMKPKLAHWLSNAEISRYMVWIGFYLFLMLVTAPLEIVLISRGRYLWAATSYTVSDLARAAASILPVLMFRKLDGLLYAMVFVGSLRAVIAMVYFLAEFGSTLRLDWALLPRQLAYALPFGLAVLIEILQGSLPQYVVAYLSSPATFAVFTIGCLSIPLVDFAASPSSDIMMVKMQENLAAGRSHAVLEIWHDTTRKLALLFFPLAALVAVAARQIIVLLFTAKYTASIPFLMVWSITILLTCLQVDGVLRVFAQTRRLVLLNLMRLAIIAVLIQWSLSKFSLIGPVFVIVLATLAFKAVALARMKHLLQIRAADLLPWRNLAALLGVSVAAAMVALGVQSLLDVPRFPLLVAMSAAHVIAYVLLVLQFDLLDAGERLAIVEWTGRTWHGVFGVLAYRKG
jgi:O-antigen/teichoic acid export membrane protein